MVSKHISLKEATFSPTAKRLGLDNQPDDATLKNMKLVAEKCFEPLRAWYSKPIKINSFYRCRALNEAVKGSATSEHVKGMAIDMDTGSREENKKIFDWCKANLTFTQLINEYDYSWVHISYNENKLNNQVLKIG